MKNLYSICLISALLLACQKEETQASSSSVSSSSFAQSSAPTKTDSGSLTLEQALEKGTLNLDTTHTEIIQTDTIPEATAEATEVIGESKSAPVQVKSTPAPIQIPPKPQTVSKAPQGSGSFVIQIKASTDKNEIQRDQQTLKKSGISSYILKVELGGNTVYRLRIGGFITSAKAREYAESKLVPMGYQYWLDSKSNEK